MRLKNRNATIISLGLALCLIVGGFWLNRKTTVVCIGDSITAGYTLADAIKSSYPSVLQRLLGEKYIVLNLGASDCALSRLADHSYYEHANWVLAKEADADIAVICIGTNDTKQVNYKLALGTFKKDLEGMLDSLQLLNPGQKQVLCIPPPHYKRSGYFVVDALGNSIRPIIEEIARKRHLRLVNLMEQLDGGMAIMPDSVHPNEKGASIMAGIIYNAIKEQD